MKMNTKVLSIPFLLASICLISCHRENSQTGEAEYITVHLGLSDDASTRGAATDNLYGINVYYDSAHDGNSNTHYAYGLFDNKEDMSITLLSGYTYRFECSLVKDGKSVLYCGQYEGNSYPGYAKPFQTNESTSTVLTNSFLYGTTYLSGIQSGAATIKSESSGYEDQIMPSIQRYYGEVSGYTPVQGGTVEIPLKKTVFGARLIIDTVPHGQLSASCVLNTNSYTILDGYATDHIYDSGAKLYSFPTVRNCSTLTATVNWTFHASFSQYDQSGSETITFKRNTLTTITVSVTPDYSTGIIGINEEGMREDNNINLYINSSGLIDILVEPNEEDD